MIHFLLLYIIIIFKFHPEMIIIIINKSMPDNAFFS